MNKPNQQTVREIARTAVSYVIRDNLVQAAMVKHGVSADNVYAWSEIYDAVLDTIAAGVQQPAEATGGERVQDDLRAVVGERDDFRAQLRTELAISAELRRRNDELAMERCHAEAERDALAAQVAELEGEREADTRAVALWSGHMTACRIAEAANAGRALEDRFADRIAVLEASANGGAQ